MYGLICGAVSSPCVNYFIPELLNDELCIYFFAYLFIYGLFSVVVNASASITSNGRMINE
jgi:hypothetical protein